MMAVELVKIDWRKHRNSSEIDLNRENGELPGDTAHQDEEQMMAVEVVKIDRQKHRMNTDYMDVV